jgi:hypothetical protein
MKKIFTSVLGLAAMISAVSAFAETKTITSKAEWTAFLDAERTAESNDTVYFKPSDGKQINVGNWTQNAVGMRGRIVIIGVENEAGEKPDMHIGWNFSHNEEADHYSLEVRNCKISYRSGAGATSGQVFYDNKKAAYLDEFIVDNCEIFDIPRTFYRSVPTDADADGNITYGRVGIFSVTNCVAHYMNITSGNTWSFIVMGSPFDEVTLKNNTFYDMPYSKQIFSMSYINKDFVESNDGIVTVENNDFFIATNQANPFFDFGANIGQMSQYNFINNIFMRPTWEGDYINVRPTKAMVNKDPETGDTLSIDTVVVQQQIARISYGMVTAKNNIIDETYRESDEYGWTKDVLLDADGEGAWLGDETEPGILPETAGFSWDNMPLAEDGDFTRAADSYVAVNNIGNPNKIGVVKTKAILNTKVVGSESATITITPEKDLYFVGDEVTLSIDLKNSKYRQFNTFKQWEDGSTTVERTVTLEAQNDFTATVEALPVLSAFTFTGASGNANASFKADIYSAEAYQAVAYELVYDTVGYVNNEIVPPFTQHTTLEDGFAVIQARPNKFGEDDAAIQMGVLSRRTPSAVVTLGEQDPHAVVVEFSTVDQSGIGFSCFVGTDNYAYKTQKLFWSLDGTAWTELASVDLTERAATFSAGEGQLFGWDELKADLPEAANNQEKVYVKIVGDKAGEKVWNSVNGEVVAYGGITHNEETGKDAWVGNDMFEYVGNILITASSLNTIETIGLDGKAADANAPVYNILGQRVVNPAAGQLYIKSGKKFFVK